MDTREPTEFNGNVVKALRGGHIPGALNIPFECNWVDPTAAIRLAKGDAQARDGMALKSPAQLKSLYAGLDPQKETIVYCQSGVRASETAWVLVSLGFREGARVRGVRGSATATTSRRRPKTCSSSTSAPSMPGSKFLEAAVRS